MFKEISVVLKKGRTTQSKVMNFILTMLACITLKIDHRFRLHEFKDIFCVKSLEILKNDLENLLLFNTKFFNPLVLEFLLEALKKENNYRSRRIRNGVDESAPLRQWNKVIFERRVRTIVKFLIFRKIKTFYYFHGECNVSDWSIYKEKIGIILNNEIDPRNTYTIHKNVWYKDKCVRNDCETNLASYFTSKVKNVHLRDRESTNKYLQIKSNFCEKSERADFGHFFINMYYFLCYGWLCIFLCYCYTFSYPIILGIAHKLICDNIPQ